MYRDWREARALASGMVHADSELAALHALVDINAVQLYAQLPGLAESIQSAQAYKSYVHRLRIRSKGLQEATYRCQRLQEPNLRPRHKSKSWYQWK